MIFKPQLVGKILRGEKTMTRRKMKPDGTDCSYKPGRSYAIQPGRTKKAVGRLLVVDVRSELLHEISFTDAMAEGFKTREDFFNYWRELHNEGPIGMEIPVWVITFVLDGSHHARLLHRDSSHGYTENQHQALELEPGGEPEAVDELTQRRFSMEAEQGAAKTLLERQQHWESMALEDKIRAVRTAGQVADVDISRYLAGAEDRLNAAMKRILREAA